MTKRIVMILAMAVLAACGGKKDSGPGQDWSGKPLDQTYEGVVKDVKFTVKGPAGMKTEDADGEITKRWDADVKDHFSEPGFSVAYKAIPPKTLDEFVSDAMLDADEVIAKKQEIPDGFVLVHHNKTKGLVYARVLKRKGEIVLGCTASQAKDGGVPNPDKTMAWLEQLCLSLTIQ